MSASNTSFPADPCKTSIAPAGGDAVAQAAALIVAGHAVAVPTETVYGLAANALSAESVARIYAAKGRPAFNPLIVHVAGLEMAQGLAEFDEISLQLAERFWPGPLTIVAPRRPDCPLPSIVTAGLGTVALRCPAHPVMQALIDAAGVPLAAPSANVSGTVSATTAEHVKATLDGRIPMILDGGHCPTGIESTIVRPCGDHIAMLRPGPVTATMLADATGLPVLADTSGKVTAPGQLSSHYSPGKPVLLNCTQPPPDAFVIGFGDVPCDFALSRRGDTIEAASRLFDALHAGRDSDKPRIAVSPIPPDGLGLAINDRLARAAV